MVGICGEIGDRGTDHPEMARQLSSIESTTTSFKNDEGTVTADLHNDHDQPAYSKDGEVLFWVWGNIYAHEDPMGEYIAREEVVPQYSDAEYCSYLYDKYGWKFIKILNSTFVVASFNKRSKEWKLITDRLGSIPIYTYKRSSSILFSTNLQSLLMNVEVPVEIHPENLKLYFSLKHVPGTQTPFRGIRQLHPGSVNTIKNGGKRAMAIQKETYWQPEFSNHESLCHRNYSEYLAEFISSSISEQVNCETGILMSGGSDSRLIIAAQNDDADCLHINDWRNREHNIAKNVAETSGENFHFLKCDIDYHEKLLKGTSGEREFISEFHQAKVDRFSSKLKKEYSLLLTGMYGDTLYKGHWIPRMEVDSPVGTIKLPRPLKIDNIEEFIKTKGYNYMGSERIDPEYLDIKKSTNEILNERTSVTNNEINFCGVSYPSLQSLVRSSNYYPLTNQPDHLFHSNLRQINNVHLPFLDNRVVRLHQTVSPGEQMYKDIVAQSIHLLNPKLARLPHPDSRIAVKYPYLLHFVLDNALSFFDKYKPVGRKEPHFTDGAWSDKSEIIRNTTFVKRTLTNKLEFLDEIEHINSEVALKLYDRHMNGEDNSNELYRLIDYISLDISQAQTNDG